MAVTYLTGWEHGVISFDGGGVAIDWSNASISSSVKRTGTYSLRINPTASVGYWEKATEPSASNVLVSRFYVYFASLPTTSVELFNDDNAVVTAGMAYKHSDLKFCTYLEGVFGPAGGPVVSAGTWYRIDCKVDSSSGTTTVDVQVDGAALSQASGTYASNTYDRYKLGPNIHTTTMDMYFDDLAVSHTAADYPIGAGYIQGYSPNASGTHALETSPSSAFFRDEGSETAISNGESVSWQNIDDVPLSADEFHVLVENDASLTASHYLEYAFADTTGGGEGNMIQAVRPLVTLRQDTVANCAIQARLREGGSDSTIYSGDVNNNFRIYKGVTLATKPSGGAWTTSTLNASTLRYGYTTDADGRVRLDSAILEVAFFGSQTVGGTSGGAGRMLTMGVG